MRDRLHCAGLIAISCVALGAVSGCALHKRDWIANGATGMVASDSVYASRAGVEILKAGGNAVDAAAAVSFALGVTRPYSTGVGGGGFMIIRFTDGRVVVLDYRETAPAAARADMYLRATQRDATLRDASRNGHLAVATPGLVVGQCAALSRYGTMPLARTLQPAITLARDGFAVDEDYVDACESAMKQYRKNPSLEDRCSYVYRVHLREGAIRTPGMTLKQPRLAGFLARLGAEGPGFFTEGAFAESFERDMSRFEGYARASDLAQYEVRDREALIGRYREFDIVTMPPPSSGGVALIQTLNVLTRFDLPVVYRADAPLAYHYVTEAMKHAFADRARWLADRDFSPVPVDYLTSESYASKIAARIESETSVDLDNYGSVQLPEDGGTSHFCVVDRWGNIVVATETINTRFGSLSAIDEWGVILNNEMDDFAANPGRPNVYGLMQSDRNAVEPGKRPLSSMSPTIVLKDGEPILMLGASGGPRIISSVLNVIIGVLDFDRSMEEAIEGSRVHHQWRPDEVFFDGKPPAGIAGDLKRRGHSVSDERRTGIVQAILRTPDGWVGAADPRKGGRPAGY